jgi:16S rRNA (cytosine967-C5)-methyltransferase
MEPEENGEVVMQFLKNYVRFHIEDLKDRKELAAFMTPGGFFQSFPHRHSMDGAFAALLRHR